MSKVSEHYRIPEMFKSVKTSRRERGSRMAGLHFTFLSTEREERITVSRFNKRVGLSGRHEQGAVWREHREQWHSELKQRFSRYFVGGRMAALFSKKRIPQGLALQQNELWNYFSNAKG